MGNPISNSYLNFSSNIVLGCELSSDFYHPKVEKKKLVSAQKRRKRAAKGCRGRRRGLTWQENFKCLRATESDVGACLSLTSVNTVLSRSAHGDSVGEVVKVIDGKRSDDEEEGSVRRGSYKCSVTWNLCRGRKRPTQLWLCRQPKNKYV